MHGVLYKQLAFCSKGTTGFYCLEIFFFVGEVPFTH